VGGFLFIEEEKKEQKEQSLRANNGKGFKVIQISIDTDPIDWNVRTDPVILVAFCF